MPLISSREVEAGLAGAGFAREGVDLSPRPAPAAAADPREGRARTAAERAGVDPDLFAGLVFRGERSWGRGVSPKGALGPAQLMPATAAELAGKYGGDPADDDDNLHLGARYLGELLQRYGGDRRKALAAYNWGMGNVDRWDGDDAKLPAETRGYLRRVLGAAPTGRLSATQAAVMGPVGGWATALRGVAAPAFRSQNAIGALVAAVDLGRYPVDPDFDPIAEAAADPVLEPFLERFVEVRNRDEFAARAERIRREIDDREALEAAGGLGVAAQIGAGILDPINLVPLGGGAWRASRAANVALGIGRGAVGGAGGAALQEGALHALQETRSLEETAYAVGTATVLGGILGGAAGALARTGGQPAAAKAIDAEPSSAVYDDVRSQLLAAGRPEVEADAGGRLWQAHIDAMASATGRSADDVYRSVGLSVRAGEPPEGALAQSMADLPQELRAAVETAQARSLETGRQMWVWRAGDEYISTLGERPKGAEFVGRVIGDDSISGGEVLFQGSARGAVELGDGMARITLGAKADASTFLHESGHVFLDTLSRLSADAPELAADIAKVREWLGNAGEALTREQQEQWARGFEAYLRDGKAPTAELQSVFERFREWLTAIYRSMADLDVELSDDVRGVMDRLLGVEDNALDDVQGGSLSAAAVRDTSLEEEGLARGVERIAAAGGRVPIAGLPGLRLATSGSAWVRRLSGELVSNTLMRRKHLAAQTSGPAVEELVKGHQAGLYRGLRALDGAHKDMRKAGVRMDRAAFQEAVGRAMRLDDDATRLRDIPEAAQPFVSRAAAAMRREVFDPLKTAAIEAGLLPPDVSVDTALSYMTRVYNREKIIAERPQMQEVVVGWLRGQQLNAADRVDELRESLRIAEGDLAKHRERAKSVGEAAKEVREFERLRGEWRQARAALDAARRELELIARRKAMFSRRPDENAPPEMSRMLNALRTGRGLPREPQRLAGWLRANGGLRDQGGEVSARIGDRRRTGGLVNDKSGMTLDDAALRAWEAGFLGDVGPARGGDEIADEARPSVDDLMDALRRDLAGQPVYTRNDLDAQYEMQAFADLQRALDEAGIDLQKATNDQADAALRGEAFTKRVAPERLKEIDVAETRARNAETRARSRVESIDERLAEAHERVRVARERVPNAVWRVERESAIEAAIAARVQRIQDAIEGTRQIADASDDELADIADGIIDQLIGAHPGRVPYEGLPVAQQRGPTKERTFGIPDRLIEPWLESDVEKVARIYVRTMAPDVEIAKRFGSPDMRDALSKIDDEYHAMIRRAKTPAERRRLHARWQSDVKDLAAMRDRLRGTFGAPKDPDGIIVRAGRVARNVNYLRMLGGMTVSAVTDVARPVMVHGVMRTLRDGVVPLVRSWRSFRLAAEEAKMAGTALDLALDTRAHALYDVLDEYGRKSRIERGLEYGAGRFGLASLMSPWNASMKQFVGMIAQTRTLRTIADYAGASPKERARLARLGIDAEMAAKIASEFSAHGEKRGGVWWANTQGWRSRDAVRAYRAALAQDVDETIVTPGVGDRPLWMSSELGKTIGQFKSFQLAATQRVALSGLQQRDMATLNGALLAIGLGMLVYKVKSDLAGKETSEDPAVWVSEGVDRSGLTGWLFDANNIAEKLSRGQIGLSRATVHQQSRYASRNELGSLLGPTFDAVQDLFVELGSSMLGEATDGTQGWSAADTHRARKLVPMQNLFYLRKLFDAMEEGFNDLFGIPERAQ